MNSLFIFTCFLVDIDDNDDVEDLLLPLLVCPFGVDFGFLLPFPASCFDEVEGFSSAFGSAELEGMGCGDLVLWLLLGIADLLLVCCVLDWLLVTPGLAELDLPFSFNLKI